jgi:hypothetical protein
MFLAFCLFFLPASQGQIPGKHHFGTKDYIEYIEGNLPIILAAPHGGRRIPARIPPRTYGVRIRDRRTQPLAREIARELLLLTGRRPHLIISHLDRSRLDPNREIVEAAQGNKEAEQAWREFHSFITQSRNTVTTQWKKGLFLDIHGHGHTIQRVELGYLLSAWDLKKSDVTLRQSSYWKRSSIRSLASLPGKDFPSLLRGKQSLGGLLQALSIRGVPSPSDPNPGSNPYFTGGYDTRRHGSRNGGTIDGIQLEHPWAIRKTRDTRNPYAKKLAQALLSFCSKNYGFNLKGGAQVRLVADTFFLPEAGGKVRMRLFRARKSTTPLTLGLVAEGTATPGIDYDLPPTSLTIPAGKLETVFELHSKKDGQKEGPETIIFRLKGGPEIMGSNQCQIRIQDEDKSPKKLASWSFEQLQPGQIVFDHSGGKHDLQLYPKSNPPSLVGGSPEGLALLLDGKGQYARVNLPHPGTSFHLRFHFLLGKIPTKNSFLLSWGSPGKPNSLSMSILKGSGFLRNDLRFANAEVSSDALDVETNLADGKWHRLDLQSEGGKWVQIWIDRRRERSMVLGGNKFSPVTPLYFGSASDLRPQGFFAGILDEVQIGPPLPSAAIESWSPDAHVSAFGKSCLGTLPPSQLRTAGLPSPSSPFLLSVSGAPKKIFLLFLLGFSQRSWNGFPLPLDLGGFGYPGCKLFVSGEVIIPSLANVQGNAEFNFFLPRGPHLFGAQFFSQCLLFVPKASLFSIGTSNALKLRIGL